MESIRQSLPRRVCRTDHSPNFWSAEKPAETIAIAVCVAMFAPSIWPLAKATFLERLIFNNRPAVIVICLLVSMFLFGEELILPSIATWWCGEPPVLAQALEKSSRLTG